MAGEKAIRSVKSAAMKVAPIEILLASRMVYALGNRSADVRVGKSV